MVKRNLWKILLTFILMGWALWTLLPIKDTPFVEYARTHAAEKPAEFAKLLDEAVARHKADPKVSEFVALKQIAKDRQIDLWQYFPYLNLETTLKNKEKRNDLVLNELLLRSKAKLQRGLDLAGGVSVTLEVDEKALSTTNPDEQKAKITKAVDIIGKRINAFGVT